MTTTGAPSNEDGNRCDHRIINSYRRTGKQDTADVKNGGQRGCYEKVTV